jgi:hypothetical protein
MELSKQDTQNFVGEAASAVKSFLACPGAKRKGLLSTSFEISTECDCYDDAIIPSPYGLVKGLGKTVLEELGPEFLKKLGMRLAPTSVRKASSSYLDSLRATKVALRDKIAAERTHLVSEIQRLYEIVKSYNNSLKASSPAYALAYQNWSSALQTKSLKQTRKLQISNYFKEVLGKRPTIGSSPPNLLEDGMDWKAQVLSGRYPGYTLGNEAEWDDLCRKIQKDGFIDGDPLLPSIQNDISDIVPLEELEQGIMEASKTAAKEQKIMDDVLNGPAINPTDRLDLQASIKKKVELEKKLKFITEGDEQGLVPNKKSLDAEIAKLDGEINDLNNGRDIVDSLDSYSGFSTYIVDFVITLVSYLSLVDKHTCQDPSMLNQDTCLCSECPPNKQLCQNPNSWSLPQPPGTSWADERNSCVDKCCGGQTTQYYDAIVTYGCFCDCPDLDASGNPMGPNPSKTLGEKQVLKRCRKSGVSRCDGGTVCAPANPPDYDALWPFQSSKYEWNEYVCEWVLVISIGP